MISDAIKRIAVSAGADLPGDLPPNEVAAFLLREDGGLTVTLANGDVLHTVSSDLVHASVQAEHRAASSDLVSAVSKLVELSGGRIAVGVTYHRRRVATGEGYGYIFVEAGR
ncbi:hypothetical protein [Rhodoplanes sp. Z2-YC6860]|uniref:hypothetical protein n=1 Tax=Rhodoplanes sp. Z2-YC6860 TaxID=674703 RepID=UPI00082C2256|nr:hypothetical protein [Rhodoplanes sp. Z2-YC6860]